MYFFQVLARSLIIAWIATLGGDRIDLLGGLGPLVLLPSQLLTVAVVLAEGRRHLQAGRLPALSGSGRWFAALTLALVTLALASVFRSVDFETSLGRTLLFAATLLGAGLATWVIADRRDLHDVLARGAAWGLGIAVIASLLQGLSLVRVLPAVAQIGPVTMNLEAYTYGALPRLSGLAADMNRGGQIALMHAALLIFAGPVVKRPRLWLGVAAMLILGSLSRSTWLATLAVVVLAPWGTLRLPRLRWGGAITFGAASLLCLAALALPKRVAQMEQAVAPLAARFDPTEGSAQAHAWLWARGVEIATRDIPTTLLGIGYGSSFRELADFFAGNRYGNLHSGWLALWAEAGVFALMLAALLILGPVRLPIPLRGALVAIAVYNVFYVGVGEPATWVIVALAWLGVPEGSIREESIT